jgi:predicted TIM-barrel fold metal-dependent hydrolase
MMEPGKATVMTVPHSPSRAAFVDAHAHLYDSRVIRYAIFERNDPTFEALVGNYSALPRSYLVEEYLRATRSRKVEGIVWHEFISEDPLKEMAWAEKLAAASDVPMALVGLVDLADPGLASRLEVYQAIPNLTAVRQHLGWDVHNPLRSMSSRPDLMTDPAWLRGLDSLTGQNLRCGLEVFAPQLPQLLAVVRAHPNIAFTIAVMGWPTDLGLDGYTRWRSQINELGRCENTCASVSAIECIFGLDWTEEQIEPWVTSVIEAFGPTRCMFGSHLPIDGLSHGFDRLYGAYERIVAAFSDDERDAVFRSTALKWFRVPT